MTTTCVTYSDVRGRWWAHALRLKPHRRQDGRWVWAKAGLVHGAWRVYLGFRPSSWALVGTQEEQALMERYASGHVPNQLLGPLEVALVERGR